MSLQILIAVILIIFGITQLLVRIIYMNQRVLHLYKFPLYEFPFETGDICIVGGQRFSPITQAFTEFNADHVCMIYKNLNTNQTFVIHALSNPIPGFIFGENKLQEMIVVIPIYEYLHKFKLKYVKKLLQNDKPAVLKKCPLQFLKKLNHHNTSFFFDVFIAGLQRYFNIYPSTILRRKKYQFSCIGFAMELLIYLDVIHPDFWKLQKQSIFPDEIVSVNNSIIPFINGYSFSPEIFLYNNNKQI